MILREHKVDIGCLAPNVHVLAANFLDKPRCGPHADAPRVARVGSTDNFVIPLPLLLPCDGPEIFRAPRQRFRCVFVDKLGTDAMRSIVVALEVTVAGSLSRALSDLS